MVEKNRKLNKEEINKLADEAIGKTFGELSDYRYNFEDFNYKGSIGVLMEESVFQYEANSDANPDFFEAGIELKVTPIKLNKNGTYSAKERLVLNIINYMEEYKTTFYTSSFWHKNKSLLLMFYLWEDGKAKSDYKIINKLLFEYPEEDLIIIKQDWELIINKIKTGQAHEISEADTMYLGACPKGQNRNSTRKQPFSNIPAMQRAYCLKNSYMTNIVRTKLMNDRTENIITLDEIRKSSFKDVLFNKVKKYIGISQNELIKKYELNANSKDINERIFAKMLGISGKINNTDEFQKASIICKTIRLNENNTITESMSFPAFKFNEIIEEEWENSELRKTFSENKYLFVIFRERNNQFYFHGIKMWNMPLSILDTELKEVWGKTIEIIKTGNIVKSQKKLTNGKTIIYNNFPGMSENSTAHVRPHARNAKDCYELPIPDVMTGLTVYTKQCFWLNSDYILKIITNGEDDV